MADLPIACTLSADDRARRADELLTGLPRRARAVHPLADGYRLEFDAAPDLLTTIATVLERERECCRFLRFAITLEPDLGPVTLDITGPDGTTAFLRDLLA